MVKIEMLTDEGLVQETVEKVHVCKWDPAQCQFPANCDDCGHDATPEKPVYVWTSEIGINYFVCGVCLSTDAFARLVQD